MVDSLPSMSPLEITRNPFERGDERLNFPGFSPSMFVKQETPVNQKKQESFRWSIEQVARLNPADIDEFPNQEYSSTFERDEEEEAQKAIGEYFSQGSIVPSPWTPNRAVKHVTFSPLPPTTAYISAINSAESSCASPNSSALQDKADACCQTKLSFPPHFDLEELIGGSHYRFEDSGGRKELSVSSLRRNLFPFGESSPNGTPVANGLHLPSPRQIKPILKSPHSASPSNPITSSPRRVPTQPSCSKSSTGSSSPNVSPISKSSHDAPATPICEVSKWPSTKSPCAPMETSNHNIMESSDIEGEGIAFPDFSPIKDDDVGGGAAGQTAKHHQTMELEAQTESENNSAGQDDQVVDMPSFSADNENEKDGEQLPAMLTMGDLADPDELEEEATPPEITLEDLSSPVGAQSSRGTYPTEELAPEISLEDLSSLAGQQSRRKAYPTEEASRSIHPEEGGPTEGKHSAMLDVDSDKCGLPCHKPDPPETTEFEMNEEVSSSGIFASDRDMQAASAHRFMAGEIDEDNVMARARAALRRAERISPPKSKHALLYPSQHFSEPPFRPMGVGVNVSQMPWQPVGMSTPLVGSIPMPPSTYGRSSVFRERSVANSSGYSGLDKLGEGESGSARQHQFPFMEDVTTKRDISRTAEALPFSHTKPRTPPYKGGYQTKLTVPRTFPLSYMERKTLYGGARRDLEQLASGHNWYNSSSKYQVKRSSWPVGRPSAIRMVHGTQPLSPPLKMTTTRMKPKGSVSKVALTCDYHDNCESRFGGVKQWQHLFSHNRRGPIPEPLDLY